MDPIYQLHESTVVGMGKTQAPPESLALQLGETARTAGPFIRPLGTVSIADARMRRSERAYGPLHVGQVADLLSLSMLDVAVPGSRPYPAAGALYAVHVYLVAYSVDGLDKGVYYLRHGDGVLERMDAGAEAEAFLDEAVVQEEKEKIPLLALLVADTRSAHVKYHDRSTRFAMLEAGALLQTMYLAAQQLHLPLCALGAIVDRAALRLCQLPPSSQIFLTCGVAIGGPVH